MAIPAHSRWWIATLVIVGLLILISALALDQPDVVWNGETPQCPFCRHDVQFYSHRCAECGGDFDWIVAPEEESPICKDCLSVLEADWIRARIATLGLAEASAAVARGTGLGPEAANAYLQSVGRGDCGWCGGTHIDLDGPLKDDAQRCPACFGTGRSIGCGGDRRVRVGDQGAARALAAYRAEMADLQFQFRDGPTSADAARLEARRLAERFLVAHAGTAEAEQILFWPRVVPDGEKTASEGAEPPTVAQVCRERLARVVRALRDAH